LQRKTKLLVSALAGCVLVAIGALAAGPAVSQSGDDQELTGSIRDRAADAALKATGGGIVTETEMGDDGAVYGVEVLLADGRQVEVNLDRDFNVMGQEADDDSVGDTELDND
jgi:hypothetical protein